MAGVAILYSQRLSNLVTEVIKIIVVWAGVIILYPVFQAGGWSTVVAGLGGCTGESY